MTLVMGSNDQHFVIAPDGVKCCGVTRKHGRREKVLLVGVAGPTIIMGTNKGTDTLN